MHITHVIPYLGHAMGGPVDALSGYASALAKQGCRVSVVASPRKSEGPSVAIPDGVESVVFPDSRLGMFRWCPEMKRHLTQIRTDLIHSHGLWTYASFSAGQAARQRGVPHVLAPCGMLQRDALRRSAWKKQLCRVAFQNRVLREVTCLHAKSQPESRSFREFGLRNPIAIIPNPVDAPPDLDRLDPGVFRSRFGLEGRHLVLYVGRIHPVKGIRRLIEAWTGISSRHPDWHLAIVGPDECGMREELQKQCDNGAGGRQGNGHPVTPSRRPTVTFLGPLEGLEKWQAYRAADLFVMPSDFENFGTAIVEAMTAGLPVITTTGTPWTELPEQRAGWRVEPTPAAVAGALEEAMDLTIEQRREMGVRAKDIARIFTPHEVGTRLMRLYEWLLDKGDKPTFVAM